MPEAPISSFVDVSASSIGEGLQQILDADGLLPGDDPSYQICKAIWLYHPLGGKMAEAPVKLAQSQKRDVAVPSAAESALVEAFEEQWNRLGCDDEILNTASQSRVYGAASVGMLTDGGKDSDKAVDFKTLYKRDVSFNVWDPLNTSGSLITSQNPNDPLFQKHGDIKIAGQAYHRSRTCTLFNGPSVYIAWTNSGFGYVGRSVYQRAFYPLKSFLQSMITDDMVTRKAAVLVAKMEQPGSIVNRAMQAMFGHKRDLLREARYNNVLSIGVTEAIETLNMMNIDGAYGMARNNVIKNIATAEDMPAKLLTQEAFVEGFGEGTQDAYAVAAYVDRLRIELDPIYAFFDNIVQYRAWNPEFYETVQKRWPEVYGDVSYEAAFFEWRKRFSAPWPSLIKEPPSERAQVDDIKLKATIATVQVLAALLDPANLARTVDWCASNLNNLEEMFTGSRLVIDTDALKGHLEEQAQKAAAPPNLGEAENVKPERPFSSHDAAKVASLVERRKAGR